MDSDALLSFLILFGGGFALVLAAGQVIQARRGEGRTDAPRRPAENLVLAACFALIAVWQTLGGCVHLGVAAAFPFNVYSLSIPCYYSSIPLIYFYFLRILDGGFKPRRWQLIHAVLPALSVAVTLPFAAKPLDLYASMGLSRFRMYSPREALLSATLYSATILSFGYMLALLAKIVRLRRDASGQPRRLIDITTSMIGLILVLNLWWLLDRALSLGTLAYLYAMFSGCLVAIYLISIRYPEYLLVMRREAERVRYARTRIKGIDVDGTLARLDAILRKERAYLDEELSLGLLAERLGLTPHQLSEVINARLGKSFFELIDNYRLEEVKRALLEAPGRRVIDVALDAGFSSPSAFYCAFKKGVGMSPSEFRKSR